VWSFVVVEGEELVESSEPPSLLVVGLEEPLDLPVRLRSTHCTQCVFDPVLLDVVLELVLRIDVCVPMRGVKLRSVIAITSRIFPVEA